MTAQFNDIFRLKGTEYALAGISGGNLFDPVEFGLNPFMASTACWRGYVATFAIADAQLVLDTLHVNLPPEISAARNQPNGPIINGIQPTPPTNGLNLFNNEYKGLNYRMDYTGSLLLGREFIRELYVHMGFHPAWKYKTVIELTFEKGLLISELDRSTWAEETRQRAQKESANVGTPSTREAITNFVKRAFDRRYTKGK